MNHIKLTLAITLTALALLCACDDSNSASANEETNTQTQPTSYTTKEKYNYVFYNDASGCGMETSLVDVQYIFTPSTSSIEITIKDADETKTVSGIYRDALSSDGSMYYVIQLENNNATYYYDPDEKLIASVNEIPVMLFTSDINVVNTLIEEVCSK